MSIRTVRYWEVSDNYSEDGRDPSMDKVIGNFSNPEAAEKFSEGRGNYGNKASVQAKVLIFVDTVEEQEEADEEAERQAALNKLTPRQKELLGLTGELPRVH